MTDRSEKLRAFFARHIAGRAGVRGSRVEAAFAAVPREPFAGPAPWFILPVSSWPNRSGMSGYIDTPDDDPAFLYQDVLVALDPVRGINIGEPSLHAHCLDTLAIEEGETVLHVGAGSGYYTSILAHLVGEHGTVHAYEIDPALAPRAARNTAALACVTIHARSGIGDGLPGTDIVYVNAGIPQPSWSWLDALLPGGRLMFPLQERGGLGGMLLVQKPRQGGLVWPARFVSRAAFISCQGAQDEETGRGLTEAFASDDWREVRALRLDEKPDTTCWFKGDGWWLSTEAPEAEA